MCFSREYRSFEQKKAEEAKVQQQRRAGVIDEMLNEANKEAEQPKEATPVKDVAPAK
jgi:hypothetical protein